MTVILSPDNAHRIALELFYGTLGGLGYNDTAGTPMQRDPSPETAAYVAGMMDGLAMAYWNMMRNGGTRPRDPDVQAAAITLADGFENVQTIWEALGHEIAHLRGQGCPEPGAMIAAFAYTQELALWFHGGVHQLADHIGGSYDPETPRPPRGSLGLDAGGWLALMASAVAEHDHGEPA